MDWVTGVKLTTLPPAELRTLVATGQEAFLTQLLEIGFLHGDPHPGNLLKVARNPKDFEPLSRRPPPPPHTPSHRRLVLCTATHARATS